MEGGGLGVGVGLVVVVGGVEPGGGAGGNRVSTKRARLTTRGFITGAQSTTDLSLSPFLSRRLAASAPMVECLVYLKGVSGLKKRYSSSEPVGEGNNAFYQTQSPCQTKRIQSSSDGVRLE